MSVIKSLIIFVSGAAVGGSTAALITYRLTVKKWEVIADERVKSMQDYVDELRAKDAAGELLSQLNYSSDEIGPGDAQNKKEDTVKAEEVKKPVSSSNGNRRAGDIDYTSFYQGVEKPKGSAYEEVLASETHPVEEDEEDEEDEDVLTRHNRRIQEMLERNQGDKARPKIIRADEFDEYEFHDKVTLYYYTEDNILTTEDEEIVDDVEAYIGDALTKYGFKDNDEKVIYVRNINRGTDYEVAKVFGSFEEDY